MEAGKAFSRKQVESLLETLENLNDDLLLAINTRKLKPHSRNIETLQNEIKALVSVIAYLKKQFPGYESGLNEQISLLNETVEDFRSMDRLAKDSWIHFLLS